MYPGPRGHVGQDRRLVARPVRPAAGQHLGSGVDGLVDLPRHPVHRGRVDQRPDDGVRVAGVADGQRGGPGHQPGHELVVDGTFYDHLARVHADLALVEESGERRGLHRVVQVRVGQHDKRVVAAQLEHAALQVPPGPFGEHPPGGRGAGEVDAPHLGPLEELVRDRRRLTGRVRDHVHHPRGEAGLLA